MPSLLELQRSLGRALIEPDRAAEVAPLLRGAAPVAVRRLSVYRGNVYANCAKALADTYPIVLRIVGEDFFAGLAYEYTRAHPSTSGDLNAFGDALPGFVAAFRHTADLPYLPDVARMEWLAHRAYFAGDAAPLDLARLRGIAPADLAALRPILAPACALLESRWPLARIWEVHQADYRGDFALALDDGPDRILVHRPVWGARVASLPRGEFRFLASATADESLGVALEAALACDSGFDLGAALASWVAVGVVVDLA